MSKVLVTQYIKNINFAEAEKYGEVVFLTSEEYRPEPVVALHNDSIVDEIRRNFNKHYIPGEDYIMTTGSAIPNVIVGGLIAGRSINNQRVEHKILKWSNRTSGYELFKLRI